MKHFSLEEYQKNPSRKIITRDCRNARILCTDRISYDYPVVALVQENGNERMYSYTKDGLWFENAQNSNDIFFVPEKKEGWINLYKFNSVTIPGTKVYDTEEEAKFEIGNKFENYISTKKIEWEE